MDTVALMDAAAAEQSEQQQATATPTAAPDSDDNDNNNESDAQQHDPNDPPRPLTEREKSEIAVLTYAPSSTALLLGPVGEPPTLAAAAAVSVALVAKVACARFCWVVLLVVLWWSAGG